MIHVLDFKTEKLVALLDNKPDAAVYWDDVHHQALSDNVDTFDFTMPANIKESEYVGKQNLVVIKDEDGFYKEFIIYDVYQSKHYKEVKTNASYTILAKQKIIAPRTLSNQTLEQSAEYVLQGTEWELGEVEFAGSRNITWSTHVDALSALKDLAYLYGLEMRFRVEISSNRISGRYVDFVLRVGGYRGKEIVGGKDLIELKRRENTDVYTALIGVAPDINGVAQPTVQITDEDALQRWGKGGKHLWGVYSPTQEELQPAGANLIRGTKDFSHYYWKNADTGISAYDQDFMWAKIKGVYPNGPYTSMTEQQVTIQANQKYTLSAMFKTNATTPQTVSATVGPDLRQVKPQAVNSTWRKLWWTFDGTNETSELQFLRFESTTATASNPIFVSHIKLEYGSKPTDWNTAIDERLEELTRAQLDLLINTVVQYEADAASIEHLFGYSHEKVRIGDSVRIKDDSYVPPLYLDARVIDLKRSISDPSKKKYLIGNFIEYSEQDVMKTFNELQAQLNAKVEMHKGDTPPLNPYDGMLWIDTSNPEQDVWKRYDSESGTWKEGASGEAGPPGLTSYIHIAYATDSTGTTGFSTTDASGKTYIGTYTDFNAEASTDPSKYKWSLIKGDKGDKGEQGLQGDPGEQGIQGPAGADGVSSYTHIAYANNSTGTLGFSTTDSVDKSYIGMYVDNVANDSTDPSRYRWTLIKGANGAQGTPGAPGADGQTPYLHIAYATNSTGTAGFSTTVSEGKTYIGVYTDFIQNDSTDPTKYSWSLIKGEQGEAGPEGPEGPQGPVGPPGVQGPNGTSQYVHIRYASNSTGAGFTTTPQANTTHIGIASTTSSTGPTSNTAYTWSLFKGSDGATGVQGPPGADGQPNFTWVKYAEDEYGGNMSDTPSGKRYIGLAFNKTTSTETSNAGDYNWTPLYDNVMVGGRNLIIDSYLERVDPVFATMTITEREFPTTSDIVKVTFNDTTTGTNFGFRTDEADRKMTVIEGIPYTLSFKIRGNITTLTYIYLMRNSTEGSNQMLPYTLTPLSDTEWTEVIIHLTPNWTSSTSYIQIGSRDVGTGKWFEVKEVQLEKGNINTDFTISPESYNEALSHKADNNDLDALAGIVSEVNSSLVNKADADALAQMQAEYDAKVAQDIVDKEALTASLSTLEGRTALAETLVGEAKLVTEFLETVITESEEGIYISNGSSSTGILIGPDRISFMDNNIEVAYISNQTMQINHGIFVESAVIADFKFEKIPGTQILAITWVGV